MREKKTNERNNANRETSSGRTAAAGLAQRRLLRQVGLEGARDDAAEARLDSPPHGPCHQLLRATKSEEREIAFIRIT